MNVIVKAFEKAYILHKGQYRKGKDKIPYIVHPMKVATILMKYKQPDYVIAAGLLHDTIEDTDYTFKQLADDFSDDIVRLVKIATELEKREYSWKERKSQKISVMQKAKKDAKILVCADKLANITDMIYDYQRVGEKLWERFMYPLPNIKKKKELIEWYYRSMLDAFKSGANSISNTMICKDYERAVKRLFDEFASDSTSKNS